MSNNKSTATAFPYHEHYLEYFKDVVFLIEATRFEQQMLWERFHDNIDPDLIRIKDWKEVSMGHCIQIGIVDNRPINVDITYAYLNGHKVMFYEGISQLVDHEMIRNWLKMYTKDSILWDNGTRWAHCNATNFHHCLAIVKHKKQEQ